MSVDYRAEDGVRIVVLKDEFEIAILTGSTLTLDRRNDNVDVEIRCRNGRKLTATFFTLENVKSLFEKNKQTGECGGGLYFNCPDMILVEELTVENIVKTVEELIKEKSLNSAFKNWED